ncbi:hypothetical protein OsccyDRAFT_4416 [Leptolyngbyaceae cyanobacterium JSC-12]|nr:hypothetical protein OsccyDRAFT_4416 [Leptolyngbyaceae cyanobacterium JSC-12]
MRAELYLPFLLAFLLKLQDAQIVASFSAKINFKVKIKA